MAVPAFQPRRSALAAAVSAAVLATAAQAQTEEPVIDEHVIVIGQKFQNSLINRLPIDPMELPFSIDMIDETTMYERGFFNPLDVLETVPNVVRRNTQYLPTGASYVIRGLYATVLTNNRPENDSRGSGRRDSSQIERLEVLKGPLSILLGPVIPGGVINQVTKSPQDEDFVEVKLRGGSFGTYRGEADLNSGALFGSDVWSGRMTIAYEDQGHPQDESDMETFAIRPVIEAEFNDRTRIQAAISYAERDSAPSSVLALNSDGSIPYPFDDETYYGVPSKHKGEDVYYDAELQHEFLDNLKLVVRGSHQDTDFDYQTSQGAYNYSGGRGFGPGDSLAYTYYSAGYRDTEVTYGDVQLVGHFDAFGQRQDWVVGGTYQETSFASFWAFGGVLGINDIYNQNEPVFGVPDFDLELSPYRDQEDELASVYTEVTFRPAERWTIVAGLRYDDYEVTDLAAGETTPDDDTTFRIGATYELTDGLNAYLSYAESFVPQYGVTRGGGAIEPETAVNYELGLKGSLANGRVNFTAAAFALTRENVATADPGNLPGEPQYQVATGEQEHNGFEVSTSFLITAGLSLDLAYGYVDAEVTEVIAPGLGEDVGDPVAMVPKNSYSAWGTYELQGGPLVGLRLGLGVRGISDRPAPRFGIEYDGYTLVDGLVAYAFSEKMDMQLNLQNLLDEEYLDTAGWSTGSPGGGTRFGNPRSAYLTFRMRF